MDSAPTRHTIEIFQVDQTLRGARARGCDIEAILRRSQIPASLLASASSRVTLAQYAALLLSLRRALRDEFWGLCARPVPVGSFAYCCRTLLRASSLREALATGFGFYRLVLSDFSPHLKVSGDVAHVHLAAHVAASGSLHYAMRSFTFLSFGLMSWLVGRRVTLQHVQFPDGPSNSGGDVPRMFHAPLHHGERHAGYSFDARWLDLPVVRDAQALKEFLRQAPANLLVSYRDPARLNERIRALLKLQLDRELPPLEVVGQALAMSPQTLRRHLQKEGYTFQGIKDDLRRDAAIEYLARSELSVLEIANRLGFSEASTFHRAFKGWTGVAPGEYRRGGLPDSLPR
ncbi:AraC family transcriptional regulator [Variovorax ginsengisoli]|uniref:AraC-like DNA-binding protein n=1 Tax=Variovorax ginsengisoli TaxID=363844 RepID=A0ABT9S9D4_9BURK|nr:AraC family transcriptional regulator [Variovorax ginsengisoli]MDP9900968.1 AraC-like DNA-binding protein [Variovorax ginsengisoli]